MCICANACMHMSVYMCVCVRRTCLGGRSPSLMARLITNSGRAAGENFLCTCTHNAHMHKHAHRHIATDTRQYDIVSVHMHIRIHMYAHTHAACTCASSPHLARLCVLDRHGFTGWLVPGRGVTVSVGAQPNASVLALMFVRARVSSSARISVSQW